MHCLQQQRFRAFGIATGILLGFSLFCLPANAQVSEARLTGVVMDSSGAIVPSAQISITNVSTETTRDLTTNESGIYNAPGLPAGNYRVKVSAQGFQTEVRTGVTLTTGAEQVLNITLKIGNISQQVVVTDVPPQVQLSTAALSDVVESTSVRELPLNGRSWTDLAALTTGVSVIKTQPPVSASDRPKRGLGAELSISGGRPQQNSYLLDGININDYSNGGPGSILGGNLGVDAIQEFNVITTNAMVQYGRTSGGVISAITRSGTNEFHGSAYEFLRNSALDAKNYFDNVGAIPPFRQNQFGASAGGPIRKNNTFVFGDYEAIRQTLGQTSQQVVPTAAARAGTLVCTPADVPVNCTANQLTHTVQVDPQAARFLRAFFPLPNIAAASPSDTGFYSFAAASITSENYFTVKVDHSFSDIDNVAVTYMFDDNPSTTPDELNNKLIISKTRRQLVSILENHVFSTALQNSVHVGFSRDNAGSPISSKAVNPAAADTSYGFAPGETAGGIVIGPLVPFSGGLTTAFPLTFRWNSYQAYDDISLTKGIHTFTFGANIERILDNQSTADFPGGIFTFNTLSDFLQNKPFSLQIDKPGYELPRDVRQTMFGTYFHDDVKLRPNLTVNLGLRYEIASVPEETAGRMSNLRTLSGNTPFTGSPYYRNPSLRNFEPRVGFAWDPFRDGRTSVRGGFGFYDILPLIAETGPGLDGVAPFDLSVSGSNLSAQGSNLFPTGAFPLLANRNSFILYLIQFNPPRNYVMQWNLNAQRQIRPNTTVMLAYVGSRGIHMWYQTDDGNIVLPVAHTPDGYFWPSAIGSGTVIDPQTGRVPKSSWSADAYFHGLEAELLQRLTHNLQGQVSFTWSRCIDTSSGSTASDQYRNSLPATFWPDPRTHRGPCDTNVTRNLVANAVWDVPHPKGLPGILGWATSGWQTTGIFTASSGQPFSVVINGDQMGLNSVIPFAFPDRLRTPGCSQPINVDDPGNYIKLSCFSLPLAPAHPPVACTPFPNAPPSGPATCANKLGNAGRNGLVGPGIVNLDFSLYKSNPLKFISEKADLQFRAESYNVFNRPDFAPPTANFSLFDNTGASISSAGVITQTTVTAREIQFALKLTW
jgi:hypothetical protein